MSGSKIVNPAWTADCGKLLDLKNATERGHLAAVTYFGKMAKDFLADHGVPPPNLQIHIVIVPSSTAGQWGPGLLKIGEYLVKQNPNFVDSMKALERTKTIKKLSRGGDRSIWTHEQSIDLGKQAGKLGRKTVLLLDDITTTGNSLLACASILQKHVNAATIMPLALGKTV